MEPWQWPEEEWRRRVDQVRAGPLAQAEKLAGRVRVAPSRSRLTATTTPTNYAMAETPLGA